MEVTSYPSEKRMNTNINNLLYMNDENKIIIYQVFTRLFGNNNNHCVYNGDIATNGCGKMADFTLKALGEIKKLGATHIWYTGIIEHATVSREYKTMRESAVTEEEGQLDKLSRKLWEGGFV